MKPVVYPADWLFRNPEPPLSDFGRRLLAEGDSWFTIGTLNLAAASNVLFKLEFALSTAVVNCAYPGDTLQHMVDRLNDVYFDRLLRQPRHQRYWEAILISAGGNDLIDAVQTGPNNAAGQPLPLADRILLTPAEVAAVSPALAGPERFVSEPGWTRLAGYLRHNFVQLVQRRDAGDSRGRPLVLHTYAVPTARPSGIVRRPQGWLYPALQAYRIPDDSLQGVTALLFNRLRDLLMGLDQDNGDTSTRLPAVHVYDSARLAGLVAAVTGSTGDAGDWVNEIHPNPAGYAKIGRGLGAFVDTLLQRYP